MSTSNKLMNGQIGSYKGLTMAPTPEPKEPLADSEEFEPLKLIVALMPGEWLEAVESIVAQERHRRLWGDRDISAEIEAQKAAMMNMPQSAFVPSQWAQSLLGNFVEGSLLSNVQGMGNKKP